MSLTDVDWSLIPAPQDDGGADHLVGQHLPNVALPATNGSTVNMGDLNSLTVI